MLTNSSILAISGLDTLIPLRIYFRPFANSVRDTKYYKRCSGSGYPSVVLFSFSGVPLVLSDIIIGVWTMVRMKEIQ